MSEEVGQKKKEDKEKIIFLALDRNLERKALDRSVVRDELSKKEEEEDIEKNGQ